MQKEVISSIKKGITMSKKKVKLNSPKWQDNTWVYVPAVATDVLKRFKQFGWIPPSEKLTNH